MKDVKTKLNKGLNLTNCVSVLTVFRTALTIAILSFGAVSDNGHLVFNRTWHDLGRFILQLADVSIHFNLMQ